MLNYTDKRFRALDIRWVHLEKDPSQERRPTRPLEELSPLFSDLDVHIHDKDQGKLRTYVPMHIEGRTLSALELSETLDGEQTVIRHVIVREVRAVATVVFTIGAAAVVLGVLLIARPIRRLVEHARRIGRGDLSPMVEASSAHRGGSGGSGGRDGRGIDEISQLAREMNAMTAQLADAQTAKLKALEQLRHAEKLSTVGKLASGLAHELGTPLNVITLRAKAIAQGRATGERAAEAATNIAEQATRMTNLVRQLLDFARRRTPQRDLVDVEAVVRRTTNLVETVASKAGVSFDLAATQQQRQQRHQQPPRHTAETRGDAGQLEQVFTNLLMNAIQAMPDGGDVHISTEVVKATPPADCGGPAGPYVRVSVRDTGTGIAPETLPHIFEPFFTTKEVGAGTGLGLAVCYGIIRDHGGWIDVTSPVEDPAEDGGGTGTTGVGSLFAVYLPNDDGIMTKGRP